MARTLNDTVQSFFALCDSRGYKPSSWDAKAKVFAFNGEYRLGYSKSTGLTFEKVSGPGDSSIVFALSPREFIDFVKFELALKKAEQGQL